MAVRYKVIEKTLTGVNSGEKKFYASTVLDGELSLEDIIQTIEKMSTVSGADLLAVLYSITHIAANNLVNGKIIRLGNFGSLRISISSEGKDTSNEVNVKCIKNCKVIFTPGSQIKEMLKNTKYIRE